MRGDWVKVLDSWIQCLEARASVSLMLLSGHRSNPGLLGKSDYWELVTMQVCNIDLSVPDFVYSVLIYHIGSQWRVAARRPKGLAAIIPWEGMTDYYRDRCRHGGILSDEFIRFWWNRQVITNQYGRPGRAASKWGEDTIEGDLDEETLLKNRNDQTIDNVNNRFLDDDYYKSKDFNLEDIEVPVLSVANWGGILLHLRGKSTEVKIISMVAYENYR